MEEEEGEEEEEEEEKEEEEGQSDCEWLGDMLQCELRAVFDCLCSLHYVSDMPHSLTGQL